MTEKPKTATEPVAAAPVLKNTEKAEDEDAKLVLVNPAGTTDEEEDPETPYRASDMYKRVVTLINKFEEDLPDDLQAGGRLVSAGNITFSIQDVGYWDPNMVQHLSQLNLLLVAVKRSNPEEPRRVIGFTTSPEPDIEDDTD